MARGDRAAVGWLLGCSTLIGAAVYYAAPAAADGYLDADEERYVYSWSADICNYISGEPTLGGLVDVAEIIVGDGYHPSDAVDIMNASVALDCPEYWPLLVAVGRVARGETGPLT